MTLKRRIPRDGHLEGHHGPPLVRLTKAERTTDLALTLLRKLKADMEDPRGNLDEFRVRAEGVRLLLKQAMLTFRKITAKKGVVQVDCVECLKRKAAEHYAWKIARSAELLVAKLLRDQVQFCDEMQAVSKAVTDYQKRYRDA